jgi:hypothetical protein
VIDQATWLVWQEPVLPDAEVVDPWPEPAPGHPLDQACHLLFDKIPTARILFSAAADFFNELRKKAEPAQTIDVRDVPLAELAAIPGLYATVSVMTDVVFKRDVKAANLLDAVAELAVEYQYEYSVDLWNKSGRDKYMMLLHEPLQGRDVAFTEARGRRVT